MARRAVLPVLLLALACACSGGGGPAAVAARDADLDALQEALGRHPDPPDITGPLARLRERAPALSDQQWLVELMRVTATRDRDGHTGVLPLAQPGLRLWPLQLYAFADGWRVVAAQPPLEALVGGVVEEVGGLPVQEAADRVAPLVPHDNAASRTARVGQYLVVPDVLRGLGLEPGLRVDGRDLAPETVPAQDFADWAGAFDPLVVPSLPPAPQRAFAVEQVGDAVVLRYDRAVRTDGTTTVDDVAARVRAAPGRVVVDLRRNPGGENGSYGPLLAALREVSAARPGAVRLLVGRSTFSAATNFVMQVLEVTDAVVVGEAMGGSPNLWGDARVHELPSGVRVHVATRFWELGGADPRALLEPDLPVPLSAADWVAGRDPALEAALAA